MNLPGEYTVLIEWFCCLFYIRLQNLRFSVKKTAQIAAAFLVLLLAFQEIPMEYQQHMVEMHYVTAVSLTVAVIMLLKLIPMLIFVALVTKDGWKQSLFVFAQAFATAEFLASVSWTGYVYVARMTGNESWLFQLFFMFLFVGVCVIGLYRFYPKKEKMGEYREVNGRLVVLAVAVSYICFIIGNSWSWMFYVMDLSRNNELLYFAKQFICISIYFSGMLILFLMQHSMYELRMSKEMQAVQDMLKLRYQQYLDYTQNSEYISRQCHDLKHQIAAIRALPGSAEWSGYLDELEQAVATYDTWNVSGNPILDAIMTQKKQYCIGHHIQLTCKADGKAFDFLFVKDICSIFGNILDNAIEAVLPLENADDRVISGEICRKNDFLLIRFENRYQGKSLMPGEPLPDSTKRDKENHGYGLKSIRLAVEKYGGSMHIQAQGGWFVIKILIPVT